MSQATANILTHSTLAYLKERVNDIQQGYEETGELSHEDKSAMRKLHHKIHAELTRMQNELRDGPAPEPEHVKDHTHAR